MKKYLVLILLTFLICFCAGLVVWWGKSITSVSSDKTSISVVIPKGSSASQVGNILKKAGVIKNTLAFKIYIQLTGKSVKILPGEFTLHQNMSLKTIVTELLKGPRELWVTIPEGLRCEEIAIKLATGLGRTGAGYEKFVDDFISVSRGKEGYLFPDTYLLPKDITPAVIYSKMLETFSKRVAFEVSGKEMILASLIERETRGNEEKPIVAGIILKRLEAGWPLQIDATVQYAVGKAGGYWKSLTKEDLQVNSLFNTYKNRGFPPAPICNPGLASIKAAVSPEESEFWFYIHDDKGIIHYAKTAEEHAVNVKKYLGK